MITGKEFVQKLYSDNYEEERLYSTGCDELDDLLEKAFCDGYKYAQKEYNRKDYAGLTDEQAQILRNKRSEYAKKLKENYRKSTEGARQYLNENRLTERVNTRSNFTGGGVKSNLSTSTDRVVGESLENYTKRHTDRVTDNLLGTSEQAKRIMREEVEKGINVDAYKGGEEFNKALRDKPKKLETPKLESAATVSEKATKSKSAEGFISKNAGRVKRLFNGTSKYGRAGQAAAIGGTALATAGTIYGAKKLHDKKKKKSDKE